MEAAYFAKCNLTFNKTKEEKDCCAILFNDSDVPMGDARLNNVAALTYNMGTCTRIFEVLNKAIVIADNPWKTLLKAVTLLRTIILYGSELSIDFAIKLCPTVYALTDYNSALVKRTSSLFSFGGGGVGTDYGGPVREQARIVYDILSCDANIRENRAKARDGTGSWAIPKGDNFSSQQQQQQAQNKNQGYIFGQGNANQTSGVGAGFGLEAVPGMYEGRPERYFDRDDDERRHGVITGDHQVTREKLAPDLLDLVFGDTTITTPAPNFGFDGSSSASASNHQKDPFALSHQQQEQPPQPPAASMSGGGFNNNNFNTNYGNSGTGHDGNHYQYQQYQQQEQQQQYGESLSSPAPPVPAVPNPNVDPQLEKQRQLEQLLAQQQRQLEQLMALQQQQQQQQMQHGFNNSGYNSNINNATPSSNNIDPQFQQMGAPPLVPGNALSAGQPYPQHPHPQGQAQSYQQQYQQHQQYQYQQNQQYQQQYQQHQQGQQGPQQWN